DLGDPQGVEILAHGQKITIRARLMVITGDNEMLNIVGGMSTAFHKIFTTCRRCYQKVNKHCITDFHERSVFQTIDYNDINFPKKTKLTGLKHNTWINYLLDFSPEKQLVPDISHDLHGGEIPRHLLATLGSLGIDKVITLEQYNREWLSFTTKLKLRRFLNMSVDITVSQLFYENDENNYKNDFKFYESYLRLLTFPMILRIITGKENVFGHPQVH